MELVRQPDEPLTNADAVDQPLQERPTAAPLANAATVDEPLQTTPAAAPLPLHLTAVERLGTDLLLTGARPGATAAFVAQRAAALAADAEGDVRRRSLARALAIQENLMAQIGALLAAAIARRDDDAVKLLDRSLNSATTRFKLLADELRADFAGNKKPTVNVAVVAGTVNLNGSR